MRRLVKLGGRGHLALCRRQTGIKLPEHLHIPECHPRVYELLSRRYVIHSSKGKISAEGLEYLTVYFVEDPISYIYRKYGDLSPSPLMSYLARFDNILLYDLKKFNKVHGFQGYGRLFVARRDALYNFLSYFLGKEVDCELKDVPHKFFDSWLVDLVYQSRLMRYFYRPEEIKRLRDFWVKNVF